MIQSDLINRNLKYSFKRISLKNLMHFMVLNCKCYKFKQVIYLLGKGIIFFLINSDYFKLDLVNYSKKICSLKVKLVTIWIPSLRLIYKFRYFELQHKLVNNFNPLYHLIFIKFILNFYPKKIVNKTAIKNTTNLLTSSDLSCTNRIFPK